MVKNSTEQEILALWEQARTEECYLEHTDTVPVLRFHAFDGMNYVNAAFSTRFGGVSTGALASLNLSFDRGDTYEAVGKNYRLFCESMGVSPESLVLSDQIHDTKIAVVTPKDTCKDRIEKKLTGIDGLMTRHKNVCLATSYADCVPLFFVDTKERVIASSHSGWRGTVEKMGKRTVDRMAEEFGSQKENIVAVIGPSICQKCYEVSEDVWEAFAKNYTQEQMQRIAYCSNPSKKKYQLNLWEANALQLKEAGLLPDHIHVSGICTCCHAKLFFSHRATQGKRGNLNGFISLVD